MATNKPSDSEKEVQPLKININNELNVIDKGVKAKVKPYTNMQEEDRVSIYWGDEWNIEKGE